VSAAAPFLPFTLDGAGGRASVARRHLTIIPAVNGSLSMVRAPRVDRPSHDRFARPSADRRCPVASRRPRRLGSRRRRAASLPDHIRESRVGAVSRRLCRLRHRLPSGGQHARARDRRRRGRLHLPRRVRRRARPRHRRPAVSPPHPRRPPHSAARAGIVLVTFELRNAERLGVVPSSSAASATPGASCTSTRPTSPRPARVLTRRAPEGLRSRAHEA